MSFLETIRDVLWEKETLRSPTPPPLDPLIFYYELKEKNPKEARGFLNSHPELKARMRPVSNLIEISPFETLIIGTTWKKSIELVPMSGLADISSVSDHLLYRDGTTNVRSSFCQGSPAFSGNQIVTAEVGINIQPGKYTYFLRVDDLILYQDFEFVYLRGGISEDFKLPVVLPVFEQKTIVICSWCGNNSGLKDDRGGCISCGAHD